MTIEKIELRDGGINGLVVGGRRTEQKDEGSIFVEFEDKYDIPVPVELKQRIQDFKRFMAVTLNVGLENHINTVMDADVDRATENVSLINFLDSLTITKVSKNEDTYRIAGKICNLDNLTIGLSSPAIYPTTEYGFYEEMVETYLGLIKMVKEYMQSKKLVKMAPKQYMLDLFPDDPNIGTMNEQELETAMIHKLEEKGHIVLSRENTEIITESKESSEIPLIREETVVFKNEEEEF